MRHRTHSRLLLALVVLSLLLPTRLGATSLSIGGAEYFIDTDPGPGNGIPLPAKDGAFGDSQEEVELANVDITGLGLGLHTLYVRMKSSNGPWGPARAFRFHVTQGQSIAAAEYFIDADPGPGKGTPLPARDGAFDGLEERVELADLDTSGLSVGKHTLYIRMQDSDRRWGPTRRLGFTVSPPTYIAAAEYFINNDPGPGNGIPFPASDGAFDERTEELELLATLSPSFLEGPHTLYVRARDSLSRWSDARWQGFTVMQVSTYTLTITKAGTGNGTVTSSPAGIDCGTDCSENYTGDTSVTLTATPDGGSTFAGWRDPCSGTGPCTLTLDGAKTAVAIFTIPLTIGASVLEGEVGMAYQGSLGISGGLPPYTISVVKGALPAGLSLNSEGIVGTPTKAGNSRFTVRATDWLNSLVSKKAGMKVFKALSISTKRLKKGKVGKKYSATLTATGGKKSYTWSLVSGSLPGGLSLNSSTGKIAGIPTASGSFTLTFQMVDVLGGEASKSFLLDIN